MKNLTLLPSKSKTGTFAQDAWQLNLLAVVLIPLVWLLTAEWIHRGVLDAEFWLECFFPYFPAYLFSYLLLLSGYLFLVALSKCHLLATLVTGLLANLPATVTFFKLQIRNEPLLPWDFTLAGELVGIMEHVHLEIQPSMICTLVLGGVLLLCTGFLRLPRRGRFALNLKKRLLTALGAAGLALLLIFGVFLQTGVCNFFGIYGYAWNQTSVYEKYGVMAGFLQNLQNLKVEKPHDYSQEAVESLEEQVQSSQEELTDAFAPLVSGEEAVEQPNIIYVMSEAFWDPTALPGVTFDRNLTPNLDRLRQEAAYGQSYSPSFAGGTCNVEFEALTGFSNEHLPQGSTPFQQHVTHDTFSYPQYLRSQGYETLAIHTYYRKYWSRDRAYPYLGFDTFLSAEDFTGGEYERGFLSDGTLMERIISEFETRRESGDEDPLFIHAVSMQNHSTYSARKYPEEELVQVQAPGLSANLVGQLRDYATGIYQADAALGELVEYFRQVEEPTIIVFWGDHMNNIGSSLEIYNATGYLTGQEDEAQQSAKLHQTPLLIWSNYQQQSVDLGTVSAYNISPLVTQLYGLDRPLYFDFLLQQLPVLRGRTVGVTIQPDGSFSTDLTEEQQASLDQQALLQYDYLFGEAYQEDYVPDTGGAAPKSTQ